MTELSRPQDPRRDEFRPRLVDFHIHVTPDWDDWFRAFACANGVTSAVNLWDLALPPASPNPWLGERATCAPDGMLFFHMPDLEGLGATGFEQRETRKILAAVALGARGLKIWKNLGLWLRDATGKLVYVCDERLAWLWDLAAELKLPVLIHVGDPPAFFAPLERTNERYEELRLHPEYWYGDRERYPPLEAILDDLVAVVHRHPSCTFVAAHFGSFLDFESVYAVLREQPNFYVDTAARITDLGRERDRDVVERIFSEFPDRILFGTDLIRTPHAHLPRSDEADPLLERYMGVHFRFLETSEVLAPPLPEQGKWSIRGLDLGRETLQRIYFRNAEELLGRLVDRSPSGRYGHAT
jgi:predicted TIM-barrel fold metal-dependent hydrolase